MVVTVKVLGKKIKAMDFRVDVLSSQVSKILSEAILEGVLEGERKLLKMWRYKRCLGSVDHPCVRQLEI
jgi:hypothetical protein